MYSGNDRRENSESLEGTVYFSDFSDENKNMQRSILFTEEPALGAVEKDFNESKGGSKDSKGMGRSKDSNKNKKDKKDKKGKKDKKDKKKGKKKHRDKTGKKDKKKDKGKKKDKKKKKKGKNLRDETGESSAVETTEAEMTYTETDGETTAAETETNDDTDVEELALSRRSSLRRNSLRYSRSSKDDLESSCFTVDPREVRIYRTVFAIVALIGISTVVFMAFFPNCQLHSRKSGALSGRHGDCNPCEIQNMRGEMGKCLSCKPKKKQKKKIKKQKKKCVVNK